MGKHLPLVRHDRIRWNADSVPAWEVTRQPTAREQRRKKEREKTPPKDK